MAKSMPTFRGMEGPDCSKKISLGCLQVWRREAVVRIERSWIDRRAVVSIRPNRESSSPA